MTQQDQPFLASIECIDKVFLYHYHLGTMEDIARRCIEDIWHYDFGAPVVTIALMRNGKMVDCYDGRWSSTN